MLSQASALAARPRGSSVALAATALLLGVAALAAAQPAPTAPGAVPADRTLTSAGTSIGGELEPGDVNVIALALAPGQLARLVLERERADVSILVRRPDGAVEVEADTLIFPPGPRDVLILAGEGGELAIEVRLAAGGTNGGYRLELAEVRAAQPHDEGPIALERAFLAAERARAGATAEGRDDAARKYESALALARELGDRAIEADAITGVGRIREARNDPPGALERYGEALRIDRELGRDVASAYVSNFMAVQLDHLGRRVEAKVAADEALALSRRAGDRRVEGISLNNQGLIAYHLGDNQGALALFEAAVEAAREVGNPRGEAVSLTMVGTVRGALRDRAGALAALEQGLAVKRRLGDARELAMSLNNIGVVHQGADDLEQAAASHREALELWRAAGDKSGEAATLHNLARVHEARGDYREAVVLHLEALPLFRETSSPVREANALTSLGRLYASLGDHERAVGYLERGLEIHRSMGSRSQEAGTLVELGRSRAALGDPGSALTLHERAIAIHHELGDRQGEASGLLARGRALRDLQSREEAMESFVAALELFRSTEARAGQAATLLWIAAARSEEDDAQAAAIAVADAERALALSREIGDRHGEGAARFQLARLAASRGALEESLAHAEAAVGLAESQRTRVSGDELRSFFFAGLEQYYELEIDVLARLDAEHPGVGWNARALEVSESARARALLDALAESRAGIREGIEPALLEREEHLLAALHAKAVRLESQAAPSVELAREVDDLTADLQAVEAKIELTSPRRAALTRPRPLSAKAIQDALDDGTALLEYALGDERSFLWIVTPTMLEMRALAPRERIEQAARRFVTETRSSAATGPSDAAGELAALLLPSELHGLAGLRLAFVLDGFLSYIPVGALPMPGEERRPLLSAHEVVVLPSVSALGELRTTVAGRRAAPRAIAVLADPVFEAEDPRVRARTASAAPSAATVARGAAGDADLERGGLDRGARARLLGSRREAELIAAVARAEEAALEVDMLLDFEASRSALTDGGLERFGILHFATHGLYDDRRPQLSGLVLSLVDENGVSQDGYLRLQDVYNLRLQADLVVLSACESGVGREVRGEGLLGLHRGLLYAGAARVVSTLWKVDDRATAELMRRFYEAMLGPRRLRPAAALRDAQLSIASDPRWRAPYYWAGFVLQGEWR